MMPDSFWVDRAMQELERFTSHPLVRKHLDPQLLRALDAEHDRLFDLCVTTQAEEQTNA